MISRKFTFERNEVIAEYCKRYSHMYRCMYSNAELLSDPGFKSKMLSEHGEYMDEMFYASAVVDVKATRDSDMTRRGRDEADLAHILNAMKTCDNPKIYDRLNKKRQRLESRINTSSYSSCFGTRALHRRRTYLYNSLRRKVPGSNNYRRIISEIEELNSKISEKRDGNLYVVGKSHDHGNRKFDFDLVNRKIYFKPKRGVKIAIDVKYSRNWRSEFVELQKALDNREMAVTVQLRPDSITIQYDEQKLNNFHYHQDEYFAEVKRLKREAGVDKLPKEVTTALARQYHLDQDMRQLESKIPHRVAALDLNPEYIGFSILELDDNGKPRIIYRSSFDLSELINTHNGNNTDKIRYNISKAYVRIFNACVHYRVAYFGIEDLEFKRVIMVTNPTKANRKNNNLWCLDFQENLVKKYTNMLGIQLSNVNAAYSSFEGNILYDEFDPICASIVIARRTAIKNGIFQAEWMQTRRVLASTRLDVLLRDMGMESRFDNISDEQLFRECFRSANSLGYRRKQKPPDTFKSINMLIYINRSHLYI